MKRTSENTLSITLLFPNDTSVKLEGDPDIVTQLIRHIDGKMIGFIKHDFISYDEVQDMGEWDLEALEKLMGKKGRKA